MQIYFRPSGTLQYERSPGIFTAQPHVLAWNHGYITRATVMMGWVWHIGSRAASFKRPLLSVGVSVGVCLYVGNFDAKYHGN